MNNLQEYFHTDWAAMTASDWTGLIVTIVTFVLMVAVYVHVFRPSNKMKIEAKRHLPLDFDDRMSAEDK